MTTNTTIIYIYDYNDNGYNNNIYLVTSAT